MLNEHDLKEFYEEQLKAHQAHYRIVQEEKAKLIEEQITLWQKLISNHKKLWNIK